MASVDLVSIWEAVRHANPALTISTSALLFTIFSFWRLNAAQGKLRTFAPRTFAAVVSSSGPRLRLPLVFYASGAKPIVVQDLRVTLTQPGQDEVKLEWITVRSQLDPARDDDRQFASVFAVPGRGSLAIFAEFGRDESLPKLPESRYFEARVDVLQGHRRKWRKLLVFRLYTENIKQPTAYITYRNGATDRS